MEQNEQPPAPAAPVPPDVLSPQDQFADATLPEVSLPDVRPLEALPPDAQLETVQSPGSPLPIGSSRNQGYFRRVVGGTFNYGLGQSLPKVLRFVLNFTLFVRILSPRDFGLVDLATALTAFLMTPMRMGVTGAVTRFYYEYPEGPSLKDYVTTVAWFLAVCGLTVGLAAFAIGPWLLRYFIPELPFVPIAVLAILSALLYCNMELQDRLVQAREQSGYAARLSIGRASVAILLAVVFVAGLHWGAAGLLSSEAASYGALALVAAYYLRTELKGRFRWPMLRSSLSYGMAMVPGDFAGSLTPLVTRGILTVSKSMADTGILGIATRLTQPLTILGYAFQTAFNPIYFSLRKQSTAAGMQSLAVTARNVWALAIFGALGVALVGPSAVLLLPSDYHPAARLLPIVVVGFLGMVIGCLFNPEIYYSKQTWWVPVAVYSSAAVDITISSLTVGRYGAAGVAWGTAARALVSSILLAIVSLRLVKIPHQWFSLLRITLCGAVAGSVPLWMSHKGGLAEFAIGALGVALFPILLWVTGDSSVREGLHLLRRQVAKVF
jgi:O-antigen/teichoic acid export membrane protein